MTVIYNMSIDRADKPSIGRRRFTEENRKCTAIIAVLGTSRTRYPRAPAPTLRMTERAP